MRGLGKKNKDQGPCLINDLNYSTNGLICLFKSVFLCCIIPSGRSLKRKFFILYLSNSLFFQNLEPSLLI